MKRAVIAGVVVAILGGLALWAWMPAPHDGVVLAKTARATTVSTAASARQGGAWSLLAKATRQTDAAEGPGKRFCGAPFMDEGDKPTPAMKKRLEQHIDAAVEATAKRLALATDEMGQMTSAVLAQDDERIASIAEATRDPVVYGLGLYACEQVYVGKRFRVRMEAQARGEKHWDEIEIPGSPCERLSFKRWVEVDPGNASAWWALAATARTREDAQRAVRTGNAAPRVAQLTGQMFKRISADFPDDTAALTPLLMRTRQLDGGFVPRTTFGLDAACGRFSEATPEQRKTCQDLMIGAAERQTSVAARRSAMREAMDDHGVSPDRLSYRMKALEDIQRELLALKRMGASWTDEPLDCQSAKRLQSLEIAKASEGELAAYLRLRPTSLGASDAASGAVTDSGSRR
ncbi:hypothetical protein ACNI65_06645 [Roseateles sp. So40a]|uniref:hypothetical protein n=1 Tax=Roseateles sp. So40a TaxID=3400226 RepID=UPI003A876F7A